MNVSHALAELILIPLIEIFSHLLGRDDEAFLDPAQESAETKKQCEKPTHF
jgi:hypothetical protein